MNKINALEIELKNKTKLYREDLNDLVWSRWSTSLIQTMQKKWHRIKIVYKNYKPVEYIYQWYELPAHLMIRDIQRNHPELMDEIRIKYNSLIEKTNDI